MFFPAKRWSPIGMEVFTGADLVGWRIFYRCTHTRAPGRRLRHVYNGSL
jgi:hypothetical protein